MVVQTEEDRSACYAIRRQVFVEEKGVAQEIEMDELDAVATHFLLRDENGGPLATARLIEKEGVAKIGRVAVLREARGTGIGTAIMREAIGHAAALGYREVVLHSVTDVAPFYERLGFVAHGEEFEEAGIPHVRMRLSLR
jgi:predicted GNAT family N-acyltransferase